MKFIDLKAQYLYIKDDIDAAIRQVVDKGRFIKGRHVEMFERELARQIGVKHCVSCACGTDALLLALMAIDLKPGDEVIVPDFSYAAATEAVILAGGTPVMVDVDSDSFNISVDGIAKAISPRTRAVIPVHLFGRPCDMESIMGLAEAGNIKVIEDNAQALGAKQTFADGHSRHLGTIGDIGCTSFFPTKILGCYGDGGAIFTNDDSIADKLRSTANHGQSKAKYIHEIIGFNSRLDEMQAAILMAKLPHVDDWIKTRCKIADKYTNGLEGLPLVETPAKHVNGTHVFHQYTIKVNSGKRDFFKNRLERLGIPTMVYYPLPLHAQEAFSNKCRISGDMLNSTRLPNEVLSLPIYPEMPESDIDFIIESIKDLCFQITR